MDARLRRFSLPSWSSLVANEDKERLRRGEADSERAAVPLMAVRRQREGEGREAGRRAGGALLIGQTSGYASGCEWSRVNAGSVGKPRSSALFSFRASEQSCSANVGKRSAGNWWCPSIQVYSRSRTSLERRNVASFANLVFGAPIRYQAPARNLLTSAGP